VWSSRHGQIRQRCFARQGGPSVTMRNMVQFSIKRLFASVTLTSVDLDIDSPIISHPTAVYPGTQFFLSALAEAFVGAAVLNPFKRPWLGAAIAAFVAMALAPWPILSQAKW
jgi:hypothetical protein